MSAPTDVGAAGDFAHGAPRVVTAAGREIAVVRWDEELFALRNVCPHQSGPLCGGVVPRLDSPRGGDVVSLRTSPIIYCAWHHWEFDLRTGKALDDPKLRVKTYEILERDGRVYVNV
ncbi:MAG TPA: Rieske (2Fe-2S) protein [Galbitalea sp.]|jgi:nitrite reductase/ring-hydroxylating ferredoxin subunit